MCFLQFLFVVCLFTYVVLCCLLFFSFFHVTAVLIFHEWWAPGMLKAFCCHVTKISIFCASCCFGYLKVINCTGWTRHGIRDGPHIPQGFDSAARRKPVSWRCLRGCAEDCWWLQEIRQCKQAKASGSTSGLQQVWGKEKRKAIWQRKCKQKHNFNSYCR